MRYTIAALLFLSSCAHVQRLTEAKCNRIHDLGVVLDRELSLDGEARQAIYPLYSEIHGYCYQH